MAETISDIIQKAQTGDLRAFQRLVQEHQQFAYRVAFRLLSHDENARDAVQESFIRVWKHLKSYNNRVKFTTWLYRIVVNLCYDRMKSAYHRHICTHTDQTSILPDESDLENAVSNRDMVRWICYFSQDLPPLQKTIFVLRDLEDSKIRDIARILNISTSSVKSNLYYARCHIRKQMEKLL